MRTCPSCGTGNPAEARFCSHCGRALGDLCPRCGSELPGPVRFCPVCGARVASEPGPKEERKLVTVLFADVVDSTPLAERLGDPERLRAVLGSYFAAMRSEVEAEGGIVEKFIGDAVVALFGVPSSHEDDPARALRTALRMRDRLAELNELLRQREGVELEIRVGINTGPVLASVDPDASEGLVTGEAVNVAARLEEDAAPGQILLSERTARTGRAFRIREAGLRSLKGKQEPVRVYELLEAAENVPRGLAWVQAPMVGRDPEQELLATVLERVVAEDRPHLVTIYGEAGVGKSRLVAEFEAMERSSGRVANVARGRCLPHAEATAYRPLADILRDRAGVLDTDPPDAALTKVRQMATELIAEPDPESLRRVVAALAFTVGLEDPELPFGTLEPRRVRFETHAAWRSFFSAMTRSGPTLAVVEDIHWADPALLDLLEEVADRVEGAVLFLCPSRPELTQDRPGWGGGRRNVSSIFLDPLSSAESERLMGLMLNMEDLPAQTRRRILERAEGNPFFLEEIVRQLIDRGAIQWTAGAWRAAGAIDDIEIPDTVQAVLASRIDLLDRADKRALQAAAVVGRTFWTGPVERLLDGQAAGVEAILGRLEDRELVRAGTRSVIAGQREFTFKHVLTRDVAYESLTYHDRADAHARVGQWLEEATGERREEFAELLAHHYEEAHRVGRSDPGSDRGRLEEWRIRAFEYLLRASEGSRSRLVLDPAQRLAQRALALAADERERSHALEALGEAFLFEYWGDRAWQYLRDAVDARLVGDPDDRRGIARLCARSLESPIRWGAMREFPSEQEATRYMEIGMARVGEEDSEELVRLLTARALWPAAYVDAATPDERFGEARETGERAAGIARRLGRQDLESAALDAVGTTFYIRGDYGAMQTTVRRRLDLVPTLTDPREIEDSLAMAAWCHFHLGGYREAFELADDGFQRSLPISPAMALHSLEWRALARFRLGDWDGFFGDVALAERLVASRRESPPGFIARPFAVAALLQEVRGDAAEADRLLDQVPAEEEWDPQESGRSTPWIARFFARRGRFDDARAVLDRPHTGTVKENLGLILEARCDVIAEQKAWENAAAVVELARAESERAGLRALPCHAHRLEGLALLAGGDARAAAVVLGEAREGFDRLEAGWEGACTALALARALAAAGRAGEAGEMIGRCMPLFDRLRSWRELRLAREVQAAL